MQLPTTVHNIAEEKAFHRTHKEQNMTLSSQSQGADQMFPDLLDLNNDIFDNFDDFDLTEDLALLNNTDTSGDIKNTDNQFESKIKTKRKKSSYLNNREEQQKKKKKKKAKS